MVKLDQRESDDKDKNEADRRRQRERARERRRSELSNETKGRKNKQTFLLSPLLSVSVLLVAAPFSSESLKKKKKNADAAFKAARNIYSALQRLSVLFIRCLMSERT